MFFLPAPAPLILAASLVPICAHAVLPSGIQGEQILEAAKTGRLDRVRELASADPDLFQARDVAGYSALRWVAIRGNSEVVRLLAENAADPNSVAADGGTSRMVRLIMMTRG